MAQSRWYKEKETDKIWWLDNGKEIEGVFVFSFDKNKQYNLFADYPEKLKPEEKDIFDRENPYWAEFFKR